MKRPVFLDSSAIYTLADRADTDHLRIRKVYRNPTLTFVLHDLILVEALSLLTKRLYKGAALQTIETFRQSDRVEKVKVSEDLLEAGWRRCLRYADKDWDWIDCVSFELMDRRGIQEALSLDRHFAQAGFTLLVD